MSCKFFKKSSSLLELKSALKPLSDNSFLIFSKYSYSSSTALSPFLNSFPTFSILFSTISRSLRTNSVSIVSKSSIGEILPST